MAIDVNKANAATTTISAAMADIRAKVNVAGGGTAQGVDAAKILAAVNDNKDALVAAGGGANFSKIQDLVTQLNSDFTGEAGQANQAGSKFNQDMAALTTALNSAGVQFDTTTQLGHFDGNVASSSSGDAATSINAAISSWDSSLTNSDASAKASGLTSSSKSMIDGAQAYVNGANLSSDEKAKLQPLLDAAKAAQTTLAGNASQGNAFLDAWRPLKAELAASGLTGMNS